jgi:hypothetical protein
LLPPGDFGVVIPAKPEHLHWVRGTCASIRYFMADTPICVVLDGSGFPRDLRDTYDITVVLARDVEHDALRDLSFGSLRAKNAALWASPFAHFMLIDADAVAWGDMRIRADFKKYDFVLDSGNPGPEYVRRWIMDVDVVACHFPEFDARGNAHRFANTGVWFGRRDLLDLDRYLELVRFSLAHPGTFYADQGLLNFMVFSAADAGALRLGQEHLQVTTGATTREDVARRFDFADGRPQVTGDPVVLHWAGSAKPRVRERGRDYFLPMTYFRLQHRSARRPDGLPRRTDLLRLRLEDALCTDWRGSNLRGRFGRLRRRVDQRWARWRVALRARVPDRVVDTLHGR